MSKCPISRALVEVTSPQPLNDAVPNGTLVTGKAEVIPGKKSRSRERRFVFGKMSFFLDLGGQRRPNPFGQGQSSFISDLLLGAERKSCGRFRLFLGELRFARFLLTVYMWIGTIPIDCR
jgi:hypothetical protein